MTTVVAEEGTVSVPRWVATIDDFLHWLDTDEVPEKAKVWFLKGEVWADLSMEQILTHADLKGEIAMVLRSLVKREKLGRLFPDGVLMIHRGADISGKPDAMFVSVDALASGRVQLVEGKEGGFVALEGTPDLVVEVVSDSSEKKDNQTLFEAYWEAGIPEYWLVDARGSETEFTIYKHGARRYTPVRKSGGWAKSAVLGHAFRLTRTADPRGNPEFTLEVK